MYCCAGLVRVFAEVYPVEACYAVRRCTLITKGAVTETLSVSAVVMPCSRSPLQGRGIVSFGAASSQAEHCRLL